MRGPAADRAALEDMVRYARRVAAHTAGGRSVLEDDLSRDGVLYELAIIGEAAGRVSEGLRFAHPEMPWRQIVAQRNILVHVYDQLNLDRLWVAVEAVPQLIGRIEAILEELS